MRQLRHENPGSFSRTQLLNPVNVKVLNVLQSEHNVFDTMHKVISIKFTATDTISSCLKIIMHSQQHLHAVDLILKNEEN